MDISPRHEGFHQPHAEFYLLSRVGRVEIQELQQRVVEERGGLDGRIEVLVFQYEPCITVGRHGSRGHLRVGAQPLRQRSVPVQWVQREAGCILHGPGQLVLYPIVPLACYGWTLGELRRRLLKALGSTLEAQLNRPLARSRFGVWGRTGMLACVGLDEFESMSRFGAHLNVQAPGWPVGYVDTAAGDRRRPDRRRDATMSSLVAEGGGRVTMSDIRIALVEQVAEALECEEYEIRTGHPWLERRMRA